MTVSARAGRIENVREATAAKARAAEWRIFLVVMW
jgi:hypothetical protein